MNEESIGEVGAEDQETSREQTESLESDPVEASLEEQEATDVTGAKHRLLDRLLYKGQLPRYAFPTDVATFHVFDETSSGYRTQFRYTPSQSLKVALSQYSPGREVVIDGKRYVSGAIYSRMEQDRFKAWSNTQLYAECEVCGYANTHDESESEVERGEWDACPACNSEEQYGPYQLWMRPPGFAHPIDEDVETSPDRFAARTYATRAKLSAPSPTEQEEWTNATSRLRYHATRKHLLVTNRGPNERGYNYCVSCGRVEPTALGGDVHSKHEKPYPDNEEQECEDSRTTSNLVLGTDFITDVLLVSLQVEDPVRLKPGALETGISLRTISETLKLAAAELLEIERGEVEAEFRPAMTSAGEEGLEAEIYMYDSLSGGAGFSQKAGGYGEKLFRKALDKLENCPDGCDASCYSCLRSFRNRRVHPHLDRFIGSSLLQYVLDGELPALREERLRRSRKQLAEDLRRQAVAYITVLEDETVEVGEVGEVQAPILILNDGEQQKMVDLHHPLTPNYVDDEQFRKASETESEIEVGMVNELAVQKNLPSVTSRLLESV
jgi:Zn ribbon nucleic-acid-binding protein